MLYPLSYGGGFSLAVLARGVRPCQSGGVSIDQSMSRTVGCEIDASLGEATNIVLAVAVAHAPGLHIDEKLVDVLGPNDLEHLLAVDIRQRQITH